MRFLHYTIITLIGAALLASGCQRAAIAQKHSPAKVDSTEVKGIMKVTLDSKAAERIGLETAEIIEEDSRKVIPYSALMYDLKGNTWTFTNPSPLVFVRAEVKVDDITGDKVYLASGPATGTKIVTVGAPMLMGAEHKYGH